MADEYVVRIVLDGIDNASDDVDRVEGKVGGLTQTITEADSRMLMMAGSAAAVAGGLNQMTGGLRKALSAAKQLDYINDQTYERMNKQVLKFELIAGIVEFVAFSFIAGAGATLLWSKRLKPFITQSRKAMVAVRGMGLVVGTAAGFMIGMASGILVLTGLLIIFDDEVKGIIRRMGDWAEKQNLANRALEGTIDKLKEWREAVGAIGDNVIDNMNSKFMGHHFGGQRLA